MTLGGVVLSYVPDEKIWGMTEKCLLSFKGKMDELVLVNQGRGLDVWGLKKLADRWVDSSVNLGYTKGLNMAVNSVFTDYIAFISNDTYLISGDMHDLCRPMEVCFPRIEWDPPHDNYPQVQGGIYVFPSTLQGAMDPKYHTYCCDNEWFLNARKAGYKLTYVPEVVVGHKHAATVRLTDTWKNELEEDVERFISKWGFDPQGGIDYDNACPADVFKR